MIHLTRLNHQSIVVNSDAIKFVESAPDTTLTLLSGEKLLVLETAAEVVERIIEFRRLILSGLSAEGIVQALCAYSEPERVMSAEAAARPGNNGGRAGRG